MPDPKAVAVVLSDEERSQLEAWVRRPKSAQALAQRSRIVLACAQGRPNVVVAAEERVRLGITDGLVRMSVGIEDLKDLTNALDYALDRRTS